MPIVAVVGRAPQFVAGSTMIPAARVAAAIDILSDIEEKRRPAAESVKDWGIAHRFAGSKDRSAIASLIYDALRRKASSAWIMGEAGARAGVSNCAACPARKSRYCLTARAMPPRH
jgi:hypothetical protein